MFGKLLKAKVIEPRIVRQNFICDLRELKTPSKKTGKTLVCRMTGKRDTSGLPKLKLNLKVDSNQYYCHIEPVGRQIKGKPRPHRLFCRKTLIPYVGESIIKEALTAVSPEMFKNNLVWEYENAGNSKPVAEALVKLLVSGNLISVQGHSKKGGLYPFSARIRNPKTGKSEFYTRSTAIKDAAEKYGLDPQTFYAMVKTKKTPARVISPQTKPRQKPPQVTEADKDTRGLNTQIQDAKASGISYSNWIKDILPGDFIANKSGSPTGIVIKKPMLKKKPVYLIQSGQKQTIIFKNQAKLLNRDGFPISELKKMWKI